MLNRQRHSYEARVLLVPLGPSAVQAADDMVSAGLEGLMIATVEPGLPHLDGQGLVASSRPLGPSGWREPSSGEPLRNAVGDADMVVLLASALGEVSPEVCGETAAAAAESGTLMAALVVGAGLGDGPAGNSGMGTLRQSVDMLVVVKSLQLATPFLDVLRGGPRQDTAGA